MACCLEPLHLKAKKPRKATSMARELQPIAVATTKGPGGVEEKLFTHPAFGQMTVSRVQGRASLYGSDFSHSGFIVVELTGSEMQRGLSHDWHHAKRRKFVVAMSEAQWATFVSSMNQGSGVPVTIQWDERGPIPGISEPPQKSEQFVSETLKHLSSVKARLERLKSKIEEDKYLSQKARNSLLHEISMSMQDMEDNIPYVMRSAEKHMEKTVEKAKIEVHGYVNQAIARAGIQAITSGSLLELGEDSSSKK